MQPLVSRRLNSMLNMLNSLLLWPPRRIQEISLLQRGRNAWTGLENITATFFVVYTTCMAERTGAISYPDRDSVSREALLSVGLLPGGGGHWKTRHKAPDKIGTALRPEIALKGYDMQRLDKLVKKATLSIYGSVDGKSSQFPTRPLHIVARGLNSARSHSQGLNVPDCPHGDIYSEECIH